MSFLRVNDLIIVCIVQNHDADSPFYIIKNMLSLKIKEIADRKLWKVLASWFPGLRLKMMSNFVAYGSHYAQIWLKGVDLKNSKSI